VLGNKLNRDHFRNSLDRSHSERQCLEQKRDHTVSEDYLFYESSLLNCPGIVSKGFSPPLTLKTKKKSDDVSVYL